MTENALTKPEIFTSPFAESGDREVIPATASDGFVSQALGFTPAFSRPRASDGKSVSRKDMNGILYALSTFNHYFQFMGRNPWQSGVSYPAGARVFYNGSDYISQVDNNTTTPGDDENTWVNDDSVMTGGDLNNIIDALHDLDLRINRLEELSGGGGSGSALHEVDHLRFHRSIATGMEFPGGGVLPTAPFTTDGDFTNIPQYLYKANRIEMVGCRFSLDVGFGLEKVDGGTRGSFFNWGVERHEFLTAANYNNTGSISITPRTSTTDGSYKYRVGTVVAQYTSGSPAHYTQDLPNDFSGIPNINTSAGKFLDRRYKWIEMAGSRGVRYVKLCDTNDDVIEQAYAGIWNVSLTAAEFYKQPYFANSKANSSELKKCYLGFLFGAQEKSRETLRYVRMEEIFVGYLTKDVSTSSSVCGAINPSMHKTYKFVPMSDNSGAPDDTNDNWAWKLYDLKNNTDMGIIASSSSYGASDIFSRRNWDGLISSLNDY